METNFYFNLLIFLSLMYCAFGCHSPLHLGKRKKRQADSNENPVNQTRELRDFFSSCLLDRAGPLFVWDGVVDFSILDTLWYEVTNNNTCRNDTVDCWQEGLLNYLRPTSNVLSIARGCIFELGVVVNETGRIQYRGREKRRAYIPYTTVQNPRNTVRDRYSRCVQSKLKLPQNRRRINIRSVVEFVEENVICGECFKTTYTPKETNPNPYPSPVKRSITTRAWFIPLLRNGSVDFNRLIKQLASQFQQGDPASFENCTSTSAVVFPFKFQALTLTSSPLFSGISACNQIFENIFVSNTCDRTINAKSGDFCDEQQSWCDHYPEFMEKACSESCCKRRNCIFDETPNVGWTSWSSWGVCPAPCGREATQVRIRSCPLGVVGVSPCLGEKTETRVCQGKQCPTWSEWGAWSSCHVTCGTQRQVSTRECLNAHDDRSACPGNSRKSKICDRGNCFGFWSSWENWSLCSKSCGSGIQLRRRNCTGANFCRPSRNGIRSIERQFCNGEHCAYWAIWGTWSRCSVSCGGSNTFVRRRRRCIQGQPGDNGCNGIDEERKKCGRRACSGPHWESWSSWSDCTWRKRVRRCVGGSPELCPGSEISYKRCKNCGNAFGSWSEWTTWSNTCNQRCFYGTRQRQRHCFRSNYNGQSDCTGPTNEVQRCYPPNC